MDLSRDISFIGKQYLGYSNKVSIVSDGDRVEAWTYKIIVICDNDSEIEINKTRDRTFYYCSIDESDRLLDLKEVFERRKNETEKEERDRIVLWKKFRDAFNKRLKTYEKPLAKEESSEKVDYTEILGKGIQEE